MEGYYTSYKCKGCSKETILITDQVNRTLAQSKYISCSHCGCKKLIKEKSTDDLREIMKGRKYKRVNGALMQIE